MMSESVPNLALGTTVEESLTPSVLSGKKRPNTQTLAADLCNSQFLKMSCVGADGKTPRSISITAAENRVLRMPDSGLMFKQQRSLQDMLTDIYEDPNGFEEFIEDIRSEMKPHTDVVPSPFDSRCGCLSDYTIDDSIVVGRGRFSVVHFATRIRDMQPCALKKINCNPLPGESKEKASVSPEKCLKEVGLLRSLEHPNIIKYMDSFLHESELYIILEWAGKGDLKELISEQRNSGFHMSEIKVWTLFSQCCEAIRHMHEKRIIHRDIKPSNVFVMEDGSLKLGDLGLGRYLDLQSILAFSQVGTPLYMSPEVLRGEGHHFASDIWSLGCLLYELATLRSPFQEKGLTMDRLFIKIVKGDFSRKNYPSKRVSHVIESMLNTDPKQRPDIHWVGDTSLLACRVSGAKDFKTSVPSSLPGSKHLNHSHLATSHSQANNTEVRDSVTRPSAEQTVQTNDPLVPVINASMTGDNMFVVPIDKSVDSVDSEGLLDNHDEFSVGSRGPSMPRIAEGSYDTSVDTAPSLASSSKMADHNPGQNMYQTMYNEEETNLMNELAELQDLTISNDSISNNRRRKHHRTGFLSAKAIHPMDDVTPDPPATSFDTTSSNPPPSSGAASSSSASSSPLRPDHEDEVDVAGPSDRDLDDRVQHCLFQSSDEVRSNNSSNSRPNSAQRLMSPSSSRRIINLVSGLINRKNSCKVHTEE